MSFQTHANYTWPTGYEGGFASTNPFKTVVSPSMGFRAGTDGVIVGRFAWADVDGFVSNSGSGTPTGFAYRNQQAVILQVNGSFTDTINAGFPVTLAEGGDFFARSSSPASVGQTVYAAVKDGSIATAAKGATPAGTVDTGWIVGRGGDAGDLIVINGPNHTPAIIDTPPAES